MKEPVNPFDYADQISKGLSRGILLNTFADKFNSMVIGWGHLGVIWNLPAFVVYVRQSRYTHLQLDRSGEFTVSIPSGPDERLSPEILRLFGSQSGRDINKADYVTLVDSETIHTPGILEVPLTLECRVLYQQDQDPGRVPEELLRRFYRAGSDQGDFHTAYIGQIVNSYIIRKENS